MSAHNPGLNPDQDLPFYSGPLVDPLNSPSDLEQLSDLNPLMLTEPEALLLSPLDAENTPFLASEAPDIFSPSSLSGLADNGFSVTSEDGGLTSDDLAPIVMEARDLWSSYPDAEEINWDALIFQIEDLEGTALGHVDGNVITSRR